MTVEEMVEMVKSLENALDNGRIVTAHGGIVQGIMIYPGVGIRAMVHIELDAHNDTNSIERGLNFRIKTSKSPFTYRSDEDVKKEEMRKLHNEIESANVRIRENQKRIKELKKQLGVL